MSKVILIECKNPRNYSLTKGSSYIVLKSTDRFYTVENDKKLIAKYAKDLFEETSELKPLKQEVIEEVIAPAPEPKVLTYEEINELIKISFEYGDDGDEYIIELSISNKDYSKNQGSTLQIYNCAISCGITLIGEVNILMLRIMKFVSYFEHLNENDKYLLGKLLFEKIIKNTLSEFTDASMISTNRNAMYFNIMEEVLNPLSLSYSTLRNTNSGNDITIWILKKN